MYQCKLLFRTSDVLILDSNHFEGIFRCFGVSRRYFPAPPTVVHDKSLLCACAVLPPRATFRTWWQLSVAPSPLLSRLAAMRAVCALLACTAALLRSESGVRTVLLERGEVAQGGTESTSPLATEAAAGHSPLRTQDLAPPVRTVESLASTSTLRTCHPQDNFTATFEFLHGCLL